MTECQQALVDPGDARLFQHTPPFLDLGLQVRLEPRRRGLLACGRQQTELVQLREQLSYLFLEMSQSSFAVRSGEFAWVLCNG